VIALNQCEAEGKADGDRMLRYTSKIQAPVVTYLYEGGHSFPPQASQAIVDFFKLQK
jgi:hypothetical protein